MQTPVRHARRAKLLALCAAALLTRSATADGDGTPPANPPAGGIGAAVHGGGTFVIDSQASKLVVKTKSTGLLGGLGHDHEIRAVSPTGTIVYDPASPAASSVAIEVDIGTLRVVDPDVSESDKTSIKESMLGADVLGFARHKKIAFKSTRVEGAWPWVTVTGEITIRGVGRTITMRVDVEPEEQGSRLRAKGHFSASLAGWSIEPPTALGGSIKVDDEITLEIEAVADRPK